MATIFARAFKSFLSSIAYSYFYFREDHHTRFQNTKHNMPKGRPLSLQTVELKVRMCCTGCERVVKNAIFKLKGIDSVEVELEMEKVTVVGYVDRNKVLKAVRRAGKESRILALSESTIVLHISESVFQGHNQRVQGKLQLLQAWLQSCRQAWDHSGEPAGRRQGQQHV
ncbi:hypothetical protein OIU84_024094 [Salix udensis]|uniref:HMA domain-containing protein n=1 Tax=Salix udensis TaxID=889485 RepID=A0AAD6KH34_9ROSI|nr:hypothetical protein OIU84_024094 [Salix udensis]